MGELESTLNTQVTTNVKRLNKRYRVSRSRISSSSSSPR